MVTEEEITEINKKLGGQPINAGSLEYAIQTGKDKTIYHQIALLLRAILVDHPFTDGNKRTAVFTTYLILERNRIPMDMEKRTRINKTLLKITKEANDSIVNIERRIRYAVEGN